VTAAFSREVAERSLKRHRAFLTCACSPLIDEVKDMQVEDPFSPIDWDDWEDPEADEYVSR
jgi:hypothetical protein